MAAGFGAAGLGVGGGVRLLKHIIDSSRGAATRAPIRLAPAVAPIAEVPVEVSEEEAAQLGKQGVRVKTAELIPGLIGGAALALGTVGGYKGIGGWLDKRKLEAAKQQRDMQRNRIEKLLTMQPDQADAALGAQMKIAEDAFMQKVADGIPDMVPNWMSVPAGAALATLGMAAFNKARGDNKFDNTSKAIRSAYESQPTETPRLVMVPVLRKKQPPAAIGGTALAKAAASPIQWPDVNVTGPSGGVMRRNIASRMTPAVKPVVPAAPAPIAR